MTGLATAGVVRIAVVAGPETIRPLSSASASQKSWITGPSRRWTAMLSVIIKTARRRSERGSLRKRRAASRAEPWIIVPPPNRKPSTSSSMAFRTASRSPLNARISRLRRLNTRTHTRSPGRSSSSAWRDAAATFDTRGRMLPEMSKSRMRSSGSSPAENWTIGCGLPSSRMRKSFLSKPVRTRPSSTTSASTCTNRTSARKVGVVCAVSSAALSGRASQTEVLGARLHRLDAEVNVLLQRDTQLLRAVDDVLAVHAAREGLVLHLLLDAGYIYFVYSASWLDVGDGGDESGQLVAGVENLLQVGHARHTAVIGVRENGAADLFVHTAFGEHRLAFHGVIGRANG